MGLLNAMSVSFDRNKTMQELEEFDWGEPNAASTYAPECFHLRRRPLADLTIDEMSFMIRCGIGLRYLIPLSLENLRANPRLNGDTPRTDLLGSILKINVCFWLSLPEFWFELEELANRMRSDSIIGEQIFRAVQELKQTVRL
jgi:hypothetical protein